MSSTTAVKVMCHKSSSAVHLESRQKRATAENFSMKTINGVQQKKMFFTPWSIDVSPQPLKKRSLISCGK